MLSSSFRITLFANIIKECPMVAIVTEKEQERERSAFPFLLSYALLVYLSGLVLPYLASLHLDESIVRTVVIGLASLILLLPLFHPEIPIRKFWFIAGGIFLIGLLHFATVVVLGKYFTWLALMVALAAVTIFLAGISGVFYLLSLLYNAWAEKKYSPS